jgi:hypothetical protein
MGVPGTGFGYQLGHETLFFSPGKKFADRLSGYLGARHSLEVGLFIQTVIQVFRQAQTEGRHKFSLVMYSVFQIVIRSVFFVNG